MAHRIREAGGKIILDLCDNVFVPPEDGPRPFTLAVMPLANGVTASTGMLGEALAPYIPAGVPIVAISDCVEGARQVPQFAPSPRRLNLLWYGYPNNLPHLQQLIPLLAALRSPVEITLVSRWDLAARQALEGRPSGIQTRLVEWSSATLAAELVRCDMVVVPSSPEPAFWTRSPNRIISALWAGRFVAAYPLPSYQPFGAFAGIGEDLPAQIEKALDDPARTLSRIAAGQEYIAAHYNNDAIASEWEAFATRVYAAGRARA